MEEIYKNIEGTNGEYQISNMGKVISLKRNKIKELGIYDNNYGYLCVSLLIDGKNKSKKIHRLVAEAFIPNPNKLPCVNHIDENRHNNNINNLEWCTYKYNNIYGDRIQKVLKRTTKKVRQYDLNNKFIKEYESAMEIKRQLGYCQSYICNCCNNKKKTAYGFIWKYID